jgi:hypothetical protein
MANEKLDLARLGAGHKGRFTETRERAQRRKAQIWIGALREKQITWTARTEIGRRMKHRKNSLIQRHEIKNGKTHKMQKSNFSLKSK